ncbi:GNAT family N-acetyltransferase [Streptomyces sp. URMC 129]|uniref:GNAT family N-acetyltransferase n=1 Tax=Streptomyces sp. URMC 129 TaxID=3423407 RepID=UPI003F197CAD
MQDSAAVAEVARESGGWDRNSSYFYALLGTNFAYTGAVAVADHRVVGLVVGYRVPSSPDTQFVWQVATAAAFRGRGVATHSLAVGSGQTGPSSLPRSDGDPIER